MKTVNFIGAISSGKRFSPKNLVDYFQSSTEWIRDLGQEDADSIVHFINSQFILEEKSITITESEFDKICNGVFGYFEMNLSYKLTIKKELGF